MRWYIEPVAAIVRRLRANRPDIRFVAFPRSAGLMYDGYAHVEQLVRRVHAWRT